MPSPSTSLATLRPDLGGSFMEFELDMMQQGYVALQAMPVIESQKQSGKFGKIPIEQLLQQPDTQRAPGSGYSRGKWTFTSESFATEEHGFEEPVDDREATMYAEYFDAEQISAARARNAVMGAMERRVSAALFNSTTWTGASLTTGITNEWDDASNAVPLTDVESAVQAVYAASGLWPNALILNRKVFRNLRNVDQIVDRVKYQGFVDARAGNISVAALEQAFDLRLIVAGGTKNTATEGQDASLSPVWSDEYAMVARVATTNDIREPCVGRIIHWGEDGSSIGGTMESYRDETVRGDVIRVRMDTDELVLYTEAAHLLSNITT